MQKLECCKPEEIGVSSRSVIYFLEALERAKKMGRGVITIGNRMIDAPDILKAQRVIEYEKSLRGDELCD